MSERPTVYLVDGTAYVYRAFFAIRQQLSTSAGLPTKAVFGFKNMLQKLVQKEKPQYLGVAFDERGPTFRHEMDPNYKANRPPMPDDLEVQIPYIHRLIEAFNIPTIRLQGFEADDNPRHPGAALRGAGLRRRPGHQRQGPVPVGDRAHDDPGHHEGTAFRRRRGEGTLWRRAAVRGRFSGPDGRQLGQHPRRAGSRREKRRASCWRSSAIWTPCWNRRTR